VALERQDRAALRAVLIGTIGVSPEIEAISSLQPDYHGGKGETWNSAGCCAWALFFTFRFSRQEGGLLYVGDLPCHAGRWRAVGGGRSRFEQRATVTLQIDDVIKNWSFAWPRLETQNFL